MAVYFYPQLFESTSLPSPKQCVEPDYEYVSPSGMIHKITVQGPQWNREIQIYFRNVILGNAWLEKSQITEKTYCNDQNECQKLYSALKPLFIPKNEESHRLLRELKGYASFEALRNP